MAHRIWKYPLELFDRQSLSMPAGAQPLSVQVQDGALFLWAYVDPSRAADPRQVRIIGTGRPIEYNPGRYVGTVQMEGGALVWHVFVEGRHEGLV